MCEKGVHYTTEKIGAQATRQIFLDFFDFVEVEVHQRFAAENGHEDLETALVVVDVRSKR